MIETKLLRVSTNFDSSEIIFNPNTEYFHGFLSILKIKSNFLESRKVKENELKEMKSLIELVLSFLEYTEFSSSIKRNRSSKVQVEYGNREYRFDIRRSFEEYIYYLICIHRLILEVERSESSNMVIEYLIPDGRGLSD